MSTTFCLLCEVHELHKANIEGIVSQLVPVEEGRNTDPGRCTPDDEDVNAHLLLWRDFIRPAKEGEQFGPVIQECFDLLHFDCGLGRQRCI